MSISFGGGFKPPHPTFIAGLTMLISTLVPILIPLVIIAVILVLCAKKK